MALEEEVYGDAQLKIVGHRNLNRIVVQCKSEAVYEELLATLKLTPELHMWFRLIQRKIKKKK